MHEKIDKCIEFLSTITKEEADYIESIVKWDDEKKAAFMFAKRIFEEKMDKDSLKTDDYFDRGEYAPWNLNLL